MLVGRFGKTSGRPYLEGRLLIPRLRVNVGISFCVDTGADSTTLMPGDGNYIGLDYSTLNLSDQSMGISGTIDSCKENAIVVFSERGLVIHGYDIDLTIIKPDRKMPGLNRLPSLLGRDILNRWTMRYSPPTNRLTFKVVTSDISM